MKDIKNKRKNGRIKNKNNKIINSSMLIDKMAARMKRHKSC